MERRAYFVFGDLVSNVASGAIAGLAVAALVGESWNMWLGMFVGMFVGMLVATLLSATAWLILFGAMEVMVPCMLTGMLAGMYAGMAAPMGLLADAGALPVGAAFGAGVFIFIYAINARLAGRVRLEG